MKILHFLNDLKFYPIFSKTSIGKRLETFRNEHPDVLSICLKSMRNIDGNLQFLARANVNFAIFSNRVLWTFS